MKLSTLALSLALVSSAQAFSAVSVQAGSKKLVDQLSGSFLVKSCTENGNESNSLILPGRRTSLTVNETTNIDADANGLKISNDVDEAADLVIGDENTVVHPGVTGTEGIVHRVITTFNSNAFVHTTFFSYTTAEFNPSVDEILELTPHNQTTIKPIKGGLEVTSKSFGTVTETCVLVRK